MIHFVRMLLDVTPSIPVVQPPPPVQMTPSPVISPSPSPLQSTFGAGLTVPSFLLSALIWAPVIIAVVMAFIPVGRRTGRGWQAAAFFTQLGVATLAVIGYIQFAANAGGFRYEEQAAWLPQLGSTYHLSIDGLGIAVLILNSLVMLGAILASGHVQRPKAYFVLLLLLQSAVTGAVCAHDLLLLLFFLTATIVPAGLLVLGWGGPLRAAAARQLVVWLGLGAGSFTAAGLLIYISGGGTSFEFDFLAKTTQMGWLQQNVAAGLLVFGAACWLGLTPVGGWARLALAQADTGVGMVLSGLLMWMGGYMLLRVMLGDLHQGSRHVAPFLAALAAITIVHSAVSALRETDLRRAASQLAVVPGAVVVLAISGLSALSLVGAAYGIVVGGAAAALLVGACAMISDRARSSKLDGLGGVFARAPFLAWLLVLATFGLLGLPAMGTFISESMGILGSIANQPWETFGVVFGLILAAVALGWLAYRVLLSPIPQDAHPMGDVSLAEKWSLGLLAGSLLWFGIFPSGPKPGGIPLLLDPGLITVVNAAGGDIAAPYVPPAPPTAGQ